MGAGSAPGRHGPLPRRFGALAEASRGLESVRGVDAALDGLADRVAALAVEADDLATELRAYGEGVEAAPGRLEEVEERLALLDRLKRKHGGTLAAVLAHAEECRRRRDELVGAEEALEGAQAALGEARAELERGPPSCARRARPPRARWPTPCAGGSPRWRWTAPPSRPR